MAKGVYCLLMNLEEGNIIKIREKTMLFPKGYYCYVGSALNNLQKRIERHKSKDKKNHWHIDYFLEKAKIIDVRTIETEEKIECWLSDRIKNLKSKVVMDKFGSTDCKCLTHLHYFEKDPSKELDRIFK
ncbi:MAG: GIY-YIG nuclease family protein [Nanoarchaeota archaeon]|nr:GIY-YIG nuclease family protein [Nanoarchaeota archaeon]MCG2718418.1 GIY-YIG nuclease family protein [Nanoarchaeota archaeon]